MSENKDELIKAQNEVIGILFEVVKRLQTNIDLQDEGVRIIIKSNEDDIEKNKKRLDEITNKRNENSEVISRLLKKLDSEFDEVRDQNPDIDQVLSVHLTSKTTEIND